jgi:hypothetical protein
MVCNLCFPTANPMLMEVFLAVVLKIVNLTTVKKCQLVFKRLSMLGNCYLLLLLKVDVISTLFASLRLHDYICHDFSHIGMNAYYIKQANKIIFDDACKDEICLAITQSSLRMPKFSMTMPNKFRTFA